MIFDIALSIGTNCQSRYNISRVMYIRQKKGDNNDEYEPFFLGKSKKNVADYGSFLFDWSVTPIRTVISILNNNFVNILNFENLQIKTAHNGQQTILDRATGSLYPHTFTKTKDGKYTNDSIKQEYKVIKGKYDYLINKTLEILKSNDQILLVLTGNHSYRDILALCEAVENYTTNFRVLYTPWVNKKGYILDKALETEARVIVRPIQHETYPGNFNSWDLAFEGLELKLPN